jgi:hypothetical protein
MNKLIIGLGLGEGTNQSFLQAFSKLHNFKYIKIGNIDAEHLATVNNLNQAEYWSRVYAEAFDDVKNGQNIVLDMDYFSNEDISELSTLAKDNGVLHVQGAIPKLKNNLDLLGGEKTVARILQNENLNIQGLDSLYIEDLNVEVIKNISSVSPKFIEQNSVKLNNEDKVDSSSMVNNFSKNKNWEIITDIAYGILGIVLLGLIFYFGNYFWKKWQTPVETQVVYTGPAESKAEDNIPEYINTNQPIIIDDVIATPTIATITQVVENIIVATDTVTAIVVSTTTEEKQIVVKNPVIKNTANPKYGRINPEIVTVPYCCTDGTFRSWYNYRGELANLTLPSNDVYYVKTNDNVYVVANTQIDSQGRAVGGDSYLISGAKPNSFFILNDYLKNHSFARDGNYVYYKGKIIKDMNPDFTMLYCPQGTLQSCYFNDGTFSYSMMTGQQVPYSLVR